LLEDAAHVAGYKVARRSDDGAALLLEGVQDAWNPLHDDGDALRLAAQLRITVADDSGSGGGDWVYAHAPAPLDAAVVRHYERIGSNPAAAYRRAIVRAAAAMAQERDDE
jgi:hypothetical protein